MADEEKERRFNLNLPQLPQECLIDKSEKDGKPIPGGRRARVWEFSKQKWVTKSVVDAREMLARGMASTTEIHRPEPAQKTSEPPRQRKAE